MTNSPALLAKDKLWTQNFISACVGNFLMFFAFYLLLPVLPIYLIEEFQTSKSLVGIILSCYVLAALVIRPVAGFVLDMFNRQPIYKISYLFFILSFILYPLASTVSEFLLLRIIHGLFFGVVSTAGNSLVVDIMPASRRGEGLGYFGVANNLAMAIGPMISLFMHGQFSFNAIFSVAIITGVVGFLIVLTIHYSKIVDKFAKKQSVAFDRFFLVKGVPAGFCLMFVGLPYGMLTTYVAIYGKELGIHSGMGFFFSLMAVGLITARLFGGKLVDNGKLIKVVIGGTLICALAFILLTAINNISSIYSQLVSFLFSCIAIALGVGYGSIFPAYNTLFVNLAPNNRRATASSTYMTTWDIGVGLGLVLGGRLADTKGGLALAFFVGALSAIFSLIIFSRIAGPHFDRNKLR